MAGLWAVWDSRGQHSPALPKEGPGIPARVKEITYLSWKSRGALWEGKEQILMAGHTEMGSTSSM